MKSQVGRPRTPSPSGGRDLLRSAARGLQEAQIPRPRWTAERLLAHRLGCKPIELYIESPPMDAEQAVQFEADVAARASGVPLQYLLGSAEFYGREFFVGPGVFIPRPETEVLVDVVKEHFPGAPWTVVDVGTGCGAIAITLALECSGIRVIATDRSAHALAFTQRNAARHKAAVSFLQGDFLESVKAGSVDFIVANLPYLDPASIADWPRELHWEPGIALDGAEAGLALIQRMIHQAGLVLKPEGALILEIGERQAEPVSGFAEEADFEVGRLVKDWTGRDRVMVLQPLTEA